MADVIETLHDHLRPAQGPTSQECLDQIDRLISSPFLQCSDNLCRLLQYLTEHTLSSPTHHLKEYQIATEALGRAPDFAHQLEPAFGSSPGGCGAGLPSITKPMEPRIRFWSISLRGPTCFRSSAGQALQNRCNRRQRPSPRLPSLQRDSEYKGGSSQHW